MQQPKLREITKGRWKSLLLSIGIPADLVSGLHQACPFCGGKDRFRFTDWNASGGYYCNQCGKGDGFDFIKKFKKIDSFAEVANLIEEQLPRAEIEIKKATQGKGYDCERLWCECHEITKHDAAGRYLENRGIHLRKYPKSLRFHPRLRCKDKKTNEVSYHPAMVAKFSSPQDDEFILQITYLDEDGNKAKISDDKRFTPNKVPLGGSVKLFSKSGIEKLGIAEGIETALSAAKLFAIPVWASFTSGCMLKWVPPASVKHVTICADNDTSLTGQSAAWSLGNRIKRERPNMQITVLVPDRVDTDWNDELRDLQQGGVTI